jgi:hypothetical protein
MSACRANSESNLNLLSGLVSQAAARRLTTGAQLSKLPHTIPSKFEALGESACRTFYKTNSGNAWC